MNTASECLRIICMFLLWMVSGVIFLNRCHTVALLTCRVHVCVCLSCRMHAMAFAEQREPVKKPHTELLFLTI